MLLDLAQDEQARARLLTVSCAESGAWLNALPIAPLSLHLSDDVVRLLLVSVWVSPSVDLIFVRAVMQMLRHWVFIV